MGWMEGYEEPKLKATDGDGFWKLPGQITITAYAVGVQGG